MLSIDHIKKIQEIGYLRIADELPNVTQNNMMIPGGVLSQISPDIIETILAYRAGDEALGGRKKILDWEKQEYYLPQVEKLGQTSPYSDFDDSLYATLNVVFGRTGHYVFSSTYNVGERESMQLSDAGINAENFLLNASLEALAVELNRVAFDGYINGEDNSYLVYGLLNDPSLSAYESADKKFSEMTWEECITFFAKAISKLRENTGNNIQKNSSIRVVISSKAYDALILKFTALGVDIATAIITKFESLGINITFIPAVELDGANAEQDVIYFILENSQGGISNTTILGYSEIARMSNIVMGTSYRQQKVSAGTTGAVIYKAPYIVRYTNV